MSLNKRKNDSANDNNKPSKRHRTHITLGQKLEILKAYENCQNKTELARQFKISDFAVRSIIKDKDYIIKQGSRQNVNMEKILRKRSFCMEEMERLLIIWIQDCNAKQIPISASLIKKMAEKYYKKVRESNNRACPPNETFESASSGWFENFKRREALQRS